MGVWTSMVFCACMHGQAESWEVERALERWWRHHNSSFLITSSTNIDMTALTEPPKQEGGIAPVSIEQEVFGGALG